MTDDLPDDTPPEVRESIEAARRAAEQHHAELLKVHETRREMTPTWSRLNRIEDTWGAELEAALELRGTG